MWGACTVCCACGAAHTRPPSLPCRRALQPTHALLATAYPSPAPSPAPCPAHAAASWWCAAPLCLLATTRRRRVAGQGLKPNQGLGWAQALDGAWLLGPGAPRASRAAAAWDPAMKQPTSEKLLPIPHHPAPSHAIRACPCLRLPAHACPHIALHPFSFPPFFPFPHLAQDKTDEVLEKDGWFHTGEPAGAFRGAAS